MKRLILLISALLFAGWLVAGNAVLDAYYENPSSENFVAAYSFCQKSLEADSTNTDMRFLLAYIVNTENNRLSASLETLSDSLSAGQRFQLGNLYLSQGRHASAIEQYEILNADYPDWSCPWRHKGQALYETGKYKDAEKSIAQAIETNKEHYDAYIWMAKIQYQLKKYKPALKNLETALTLNPEAEESNDEVLSENSIRALHEDLLIKTGKKK
jgi:tetratricopeptide (TPR) repeat protein